MKNNFATFLALGTILCGMSEVKSQEVFRMPSDIIGNLNIISASSSSSSLDSYGDDNIIHSPKITSSDNERLIAQLLGMTPNAGAGDGQEDTQTFGDLLRLTPSVALFGASYKSDYAEISKDKLKSLTNKGGTKIENSENLATVLNTFLEVFKDSFDRTRAESSNKLKDTAEDAVTFLLSALKDQAVIWGESAKDIMNQLVDIVRDKYPAVTDLLIDQLTNIKFISTVEGKLEGVIRGSKNSCRVCLAKSALYVFHAFKENFPIVLPKEEVEALLRAHVFERAIPEEGVKKVERAYEVKAVQVKHVQRRSRKATKQRG